MNYLYHDSIGLLHLLSSITAVFFGTWILLDNKGTLRHRRIGYLYCLSMLIVIVTSFLIYRLFKGFGLFHIAAVVSFITISFGMIPMLLKKPTKSYLSLHYSFMYWSVLGLYGAFVSEAMVRIPEKPTFEYMGWIIGAVMFAGAFFYSRCRKKWHNIYNNRN